MADGHYRESISEHLETHRLAFVPAPEGQNGRVETYPHLSNAFWLARVAEQEVDAFVAREDAREKRAREAPPPEPRASVRERSSPSSRRGA